MNDFERSELTDLAESYRQLYAAVLERAFDDLHIPKYADEARRFFLSGRADAYIRLLDLDPTTFIRNALSAPRRRSPNPRTDCAEAGGEIWLP